MLNRPASCRGCPLDTLASGFMRPTFATAEPYGVALIGEALGEDEAESGSPFTGKAGFRLTRLLQWAGLERSRFDIFNTIWCRPPNNKLHGESYAGPAIAHCRSAHWDRLLLSRPNRVLVPMGNVASGVLIGREGILTTRGYVYPGPGQTHVIPTVHPSFMQRGQSKWSAPFIADVQKAVELAKRGLPFEPVDYLLDPSPMLAYQWAMDYRRNLERDSSIRLAFDIETPGKKEDEDELESGDLDGGGPDRTWHIFRIGFAYRGFNALSVPWAPEFIPTIRALLGSSGEKVVWNAGFDVPRCRHAGVEINGTIHDGMVAWHILHSDLPKRLGFVATFCCPWQPAWKHLNHGGTAAFYNATDADVELRCMERIEAELRRAGLWGVYQRDVVDLEPLLDYMHRRGMPVDAAIRLDRATRLAERIGGVRERMERAVPVEARRIEHVYAKEPKDKCGLLSRPHRARILECEHCGLVKPPKSHFRLYKRPTAKRPQNPCGAAKAVEVERDAQEYYRLAQFTPSRDQLIRYHQHLHRSLPMVWDKKAGKRKISFGERQLKDLSAKFPLDTLYPAILQYRSLDKIAGTYIGRFVPDGVQEPERLPEVASEDA